MPKHYSESESESNSEYYSSDYESSNHSSDVSTEEDTPKQKTKVSTSKKTETKKEPKQQRAKSSYLFFCEKERKVLKKEHPTWNAKQIMTELGKRWKKLDAEARKPFERKANKAKKDLASKK